MSDVSPTGLIQVPQGAFEALWRMADPAAALVYLFVLRHDRLPSLREAEQAGLEAGAMKLACERLQREGLLSLRGHAPSAADAPSYTAGDIAEGIRRDAGFACAVSETQSLLGKILSSHDLELLFSLYSWYNLPGDVLVLLVSYMVEDCRARFGPEGRPPALRQIFAEGRRWADQGILTHEAAERHIRFLEGRRSQSGRILHVLGIHGRAPSVSERKYIDDWIAMGFPPETVALAYDRTVMAIGRWQYGYCSKILKRWHEAGVHTPKEVLDHDERGAPADIPARKTVGTPAANRPRTERSNRPVAPPGEAERAAMERMMNRKKNREQGN
ncbi:MAG: DnaD domain protein [Oscillospiraceae bacterium]|nr:DnaD domain protein [Oscillospiraceae bacterium]